MVKYTAKVKRGMHLHFQAVAAALTDETTVRGIMRSWTAAQESDFLAFTEYATQELATIGIVAPALPAPPATTRAEQAHGDGWTAAQQMAADIRGEIQG